MPIKLSIAAPDLDDEDLQVLTRDLARSINRETGLTAELPEETGVAGSKGDMGLIGQIILTILGSGGVAVALTGVLKAYFERSRSLEIEFEKDGRKLKIHADNTSPERIEQTLQAVRDFFGD